jgi:hypothetical protein
VVWRSILIGAEAMIICNSIEIREDLMNALYVVTNVCEAPAQVSSRSRWRAARLEI